jgi:glycosyltransferase involved in cell wall biosynthesis
MVHRGLTHVSSAGRCIGLAVSVPAPGSPLAGNMESEPLRTMFVYWGRRGALSRIVLELARVAGQRAVMSVSRQNELVEQIRAVGAPLVAVDTFERAAGAAFGVPAIFRIRRQLRDAIKTFRIGKVVVLMSHVWTPLVAKSLRREGVRYGVVVHDAIPHPGDRTGLVNAWLMRDAMLADEVIVLSKHVERQLGQRYPVLSNRIRVLFLPTLSADPSAAMTEDAATPRFLFFGRLMAYKGLPLFVEACEILKSRGHSLAVRIVGEGPLGPLKSRLDALGAEVTNRWVDESELDSVFGGCDFVVLPNIEASQSGVVPLAFSYGCPIVATPVGGIVEQVEDGKSGLLSDAVSAAAFAEAMQRLLTDGALRARLRAGVLDTRRQFSMERFFELMTAER